MYVLNTMSSTVVVPKYNNSYNTYYQLISMFIDTFISMTTMHCLQAMYLQIVTGR